MLRYPKSYSVGECHRYASSGERTAGAYATLHLAQNPYAWRVPQNTICLAVIEVCQAIVEEYNDELMTLPTSPDGWRKIAGDFCSRLLSGTFPSVLVRWTANMLQ